MIWKKLKAPKVKLKGSRTQIVFFFGRRAYCGRLLWENKKEFLMRKAHLRPRLHPSSMHPRLAKACVNLSGVRSGSIIDPFCGSGGILIEAGLMGINITGSDIDSKMIERCRMNLLHYGLTNHVLIKASAKEISGSYDAIVTDLPYGRNTKAIQRKDMKIFFKRSYVCAPVAIVMVASGTHTKEVLGKWKVEKRFTYYLHKSLSKTILVLKR